MNDKHIDASSAADSGKRKVGRPPTELKEKLTLTFSTDEYRRILHASADASEGPLGAKEFCRRAILSYLDSLK
jgi:hypothetical protein